MSAYKSPSDLGAMLVRMRRDLEALQRPKVLRPPHYATADLPVAATVLGGVVFDTTALVLKVSDGTAWLTVTAA